MILALSSNAVRLPFITILFTLLTSEPGYAQTQCDGPYAGQKLTDEDLAPVLARHEAWARDLAQGKVSLEGEDARRANLCRATLRYANLQGRVLTGIQLHSANLNRAHLRETDLFGADLRYAYLGGADMRGAILQASRLQGARLIDTKLQGVDLREVNLHSANMAGALLQGANLKRARLPGANLTLANLSDADLTLADVRGAGLSGAKLQGATLTGAKFQGAELNGAELQGADLYEARFQEATLVRAKLDGTNLTNTQLQEANLSGAQLQQAILVRANLESASLFGANLQGANLRAANLRSATLTDTDLKGAILSRADLTNAQYEPLSGPDKAFLGGVLGLADIQFDLMEGKETGAILLRAALRDVGLRDLEREVTYALHREKQEQLWATKEGNQGNRFEAAFRYFFFELTCLYGLAPTRPLNILGFSLFCFAFVYMLIPVAARRGRAGIWLTWPNAPGYPLENEAGSHRVTYASFVSVEASSGVAAQRFFPNFQKSKAVKAWLRIPFAWICLPLFGLWFSLLSAFHFGRHERSFNSLLVHLQPRVYILQPTGWVRSLAGVQTLISLYLLGLWLLATFGRPFG